MRGSTDEVGAVGIPSSHSRSGATVSLTIELKHDGLSLAEDSFCMSLALVVGCPVGSKEAIDNAAAVVVR